MQACERPDVVEVWDVTAADPKMLVFLKVRPLCYWLCTCTTAGTGLPLYARVPGRPQCGSNPDRSWLAASVVVRAAALAAAVGLPGPCNEAFLLLSALPLREARRCQNLVRPQRSFFQGNVPKPPGSFLWSSILTQRSPTWQHPCTVYVLLTIPRHPLPPFRAQAYRNTVAVPRHWSQKRKYLQGKRGIEKPPFKLPEFIEATGIGEMRQVGSCTVSGYQIPPGVVPLDGVWLDAVHGGGCRWGCPWEPGASWDL